MLVGLSPIILCLAPATLTLELRPLCSTGITRLHRSYEPLRHRRDRTCPSRAVRCGFSPPSIVGFPCFLCVPSMHAVALYPGGPARCLYRCLPLPRWPSPSYCRVGIHVTLFEASSSVYLRYGLHLRGITN